MKAVYFVQSTGSGLIKIGFTADWDRRLRELQGVNGADLMVLAVIRPGSRHVERSLHRRFATLRHHGEWFNPGPELLAYIEELGKAVRQEPGPKQGKSAPAREPYRVVGDLSTGPPAPPFPPPGHFEDWVRRTFPKGSGGRSVEEMLAGDLADLAWVRWLYAIEMFSEGTDSDGNYFPPRFRKPPPPDPIPPASETETVRALAWLAVTLAKSASKPLTPPA